MKYIYMGLWVVAVALAGCKSGEKVSDQSRMKKKDKKTLMEFKYKEDLSILRPSFLDSLAQLKKKETDKKEANKLKNPIVPQHDITTKLDEFLHAVATKEERNRVKEGFTIQLYLGNNRKEANQIVNQANHVFYNTQASMLFESPFYKVHLGKFLNEQEAYKTYSKARSAFKSVALVRTQINLSEL